MRYKYFVAYIYAVNNGFGTDHGFGNSVILKNGPIEKEEHILEVHALLETQKGMPQGTIIMTNFQMLDYGEF